MTRSDRLVFAFLYRLNPKALEAIHIIRPETVVRWHRMGFRALWRWKSRPRGGRPKVSFELRELIRQMSLDNPLWGAPRLQGELLLLGYSVAQSTVAKYMVKHPRPPSQSCRTFLRNHMGSISAADFFAVPTINFKMLYALVIRDHQSRRIRHIAVMTNPTAEWAARKLVEASPWNYMPKYLLRDNDAIYGQVFRRQLETLGIKDKRTAYRSPWQNGYVERVIGSIRRECLDHVIVINERHLHGVLREYVKYYNFCRTHLSLGKNSPIPREIQRSASIVKTPHLGGLHHSYTRI